MSRIFDILTFLGNALQKILSFGVLPDNMPDICVSNLMINPQSKEMLVNIETQNYPAVLTRVCSKDCPSSILQKQLNRRIEKDDDYALPVLINEEFEKKGSLLILVYFHDIQNRKYLAKISVSLNNTFRVDSVKRSFRG
jgi:hypothetical protein